MIVFISGNTAVTVDLGLTTGSSVNFGGNIYYNGQQISENIKQYQVGLGPTRIREQV